MASNEAYVQVLDPDNKDNKVLAQIKISVLSLGLL
jgi:hypothetical protein